MALRSEEIAALIWQFADEAVIAHEAQTTADTGGKLFFETSTQPLAAVEGDLNAVGEPSLETDAHKAVVTMVAIKIEMFAAGEFMAQLRESGLGIIASAKGGTGFDAGPDAVLLWWFFCCYP